MASESIVRYVDLKRNDQASSISRPRVQKNLVETCGCTGCCGEMEPVTAGRSSISGFRQRVTGWRRLAQSVLVAVVLGACAVQQAAAPGSAPATSTAHTAGLAGAPAAHSSIAKRPLPFKGRLLEGNPAQLPPVVAMSLIEQSQITFSYREELTHEEQHVPMILSAIDPLTYAGYPMGEYGVIAVASLSIFYGGHLIGDYKAHSRVTKPYSMYAQPTHRELDDAVRVAGREEIDRELYADSARLAAAAGQTE